MESILLRKVWTEFWEKQSHVVSKPASLIVNASDDPTTMFNTAGMQPLVPYLMGKDHPTGSTRVYNIQGCVRTVDIEEVGDVSHLTFFEMMGNWSLGDYFKKDSIAWTWEFLTEVVGLSKDHLAVTIFEGDNDASLDTEARQFWLDQGIPEHRITPLGKEYNWRGPAGATGPCGPDSEVFYWIGVGLPPQESNPGNDEENWIEIWNNVFMGYYKDENDVITEMERKNIDTGMGFERLLMVLNGKKLKDEGKIASIKEVSVYDIDIFQGFFDALDTLTTTSYAQLLQEQPGGLISYRIVADHLKTSLLLVAEGLAPSNEGRGYVLRRIIRRCFYHLKKLVTHKHAVWTKDSLNDVVSLLCKSFVVYYPFLQSGLEKDIEVLAGEMMQFESALQRGGQKIQEILSRHSGDVFSGDDAFLLYDTFGVPLELTQEIVAQNGLHVDIDGFNVTLEKAKERSRAGAGNKFAKGVNRADYIEGLPETVFVGYDRYQEEGAHLLKDFTVEGKRYLVFDSSPFYAESGGQKADVGTIELDSGEILAVVDVQKYGGVFLHQVA